MRQLHYSVYSFAYNLHLFNLNNSILNQYKKKFYSFETKNRQQQQRFNMIIVLNDSHLMYQLNIGTVSVFVIGEHRNY